MTGLLSRYITHFRFTFGEFRTNIARAGLSTAWRFFLMRLTVPFGRPRRYFVRRQARSQLVAQIDADGFAALPPLADETVGQVLDHLLKSAAQKFSEPVRSVDEYAAVLRRSNIERHTGLVSNGAPGCPLAAVARSPQFARLAAEYLELAAANLNVEATVDMLVSLDTPKAPGSYDNALEFHRDIDGYRFLKMFVYLTDCFEGNGHHELYLQSHRTYPLQLAPIRRYPSQEISRYLPQAVLKRVTGPAGYAFAENTLVFHRGTPPVRSHRAILNLIYTEASLSRYYTNAFPLRSSGL